MTPALPTSGTGPQTKTAFIYETLRQEILSGALPPGQLLKLSDQASRFNVSPLPIREVLKVLEADGLVEMSAHRSAVVSPIRIEELEDVYAARMAIEAEAIARATERCTAADLAEMKDIVARMEIEKSKQRRAKLHQRFHNKVYDLAASPTLTGIAKDLWAQSERCRAVLRSSPKHTLNPALNHAALVVAMTSGDREEAGRVMRAHLQNSLDGLQASLTEADKNKLEGNMS